MHLLGFATAVATFGAVVTSLPTSTNHVVHEKRSSSTSWSPIVNARPNPRTKLPIRIGLAEQNLHLGDDLLMQVSSPTSDLYGKHWTPQQVS